MSSLSIQTKPFFASLRGFNSSGMPHHLRIVKLLILRTISSEGACESNATDIVICLKLTIAIIYHVRLKIKIKRSDRNDSVSNGEAKSSPSASVSAHL